MAFISPIRHIYRLRIPSNGKPLITSNTLSNLRKQTMATAPSSSTVAVAPVGLAKCDWLVILPDRNGMLAKRMEVRESHLSAIVPMTESGFWKMGGAMLDEVPDEGTGLKICGSAMVAHAASKEEVLDALRQDIYFKSNVWDLEKIQIYPFKTAFRNP